MEGPCGSNQVIYAAGHHLPRTHSCSMHVCNMKTISVLKKWACLLMFSAVPVASAHTSPTPPNCSPGRGCAPAAVRSMNAASRSHARSCLSRTARGAMRRARDAANTRGSAARHSDVIAAWCSQARHRNATPRLPCVSNVQYKQPSPADGA